MRPIIHNNQASAIPIILFIMTIIICGALYSLFFVEIGFPLLTSYIPNGDSKTFIMMCLYAIPLFVIIIGVFSLLLAGLKRYGGMIG